MVMIVNCEDVELMAMIGKLISILTKVLDVFH